jgi:hypothetical protein
MNWYIQANKADHIEQLKEVARKIRHSGDYGYLMWHEKEKKVRWIMASEDGDEDYFDGDTICYMFRKLPFVKKVEITNEWGMAETMGWKRIRYSRTR